MANIEFHPIVNRTSRRAGEFRAFQQERAECNTKVHGKKKNGIDSGAAKNLQRYSASLTNADSEMMLLRDAFTDVLSGVVSITN